MCRYEFTDHGAFELGDVAIHHGWCLHSAPAGSEYMEDSDGVAVEAADQDYGSDDDKDDEVDEEEFEQSDLGESRVLCFLVLLMRCCRVILNTQQCTIKARTHG